jgi:hypothetical protein
LIPQSPGSNPGAPAKQAIEEGAYSATIWMRTVRQSG